MIFSELYDLWDFFNNFSELTEQTNGYGVGLSAKGYLVFLFVSLGISVALAVAFLILRGLGIYGLAKKRGIKNAWLAFVPFAAVYVMGELAQYPSEKKWIRTVAIVAISVAALKYALLIATDILFAMQPLKGLFSGETLTEASFTYEFAGASTLYNLFNIFGNLASLAFIILFTIVFSEFMKVYRPRRASVYTTVSLIFGLFFDALFFYGLFAFFVRNEEPNDYVNYLESRYRAYYGGNNRGNDYSGSYGNNPYRRTERPKEEDPFGEFSNEKDPFSEFGGEGGSSDENETRTNSDGGYSDGQETRTNSDDGHSDDCSDDLF